MPVPAEIQEVPGAAELHDWFGFWPNFHDAEIISLYLNRAENIVVAGPHMGNDQRPG